MALRGLATAPEVSNSSTVIPAFDEKAPAIVEQAKSRTWTIPAVRELLSPNRIVGIGMLVAAIGFGAGSLMLGLWLFGMPGPGLTTLIASIGLLPVSIAMIVDPVNQDEGPLQAVPLVAGLALCAYAAGVAYLGLVLPSFAFLFLWSRLLYGRSLLASFAASIGITAGAYVVFVRLLGLPVPLWPT